MSQNKKDMFAPPSKEELEMFAAPSEDELAENSNSDDSGPNELQSLLRGAAQDVTFGTADEMAGALESPIGAGKQILNLLGAGISPEDPSIREYKASRDESREAYKAAEEANPASYMAGEVLGGVLPAVASGGASVLAKGGLKAAAKVLANQGKKELFSEATKAAAKAGAKYGGLNALGTSEEENLPGLAKDTALGAAGGAAVGGALNKGSDYLSNKGGKVFNWLKDQFETVDTAATASRLTKQGEDLVGKEARSKIEGGFKTKTQELIGKINNTYKQIDDEFNTVFKNAKAANTGLDNASVKKSIQDTLSSERSVGPGFDGDANKMLDAIYSKNQGEDFAKTIQALKDKLSSLPEFLSSEELHHQKLVFRQLGDALESKGDAYGSKLAKDMSKNFDSLTKQSLGNETSPLRQGYEAANALKSNLENMRTRLGVDRNASREVAGQKLEDKMGALISDIQSGSKGGYKSNRVLNDTFDYLNRIDPKFAASFKEDIQKLGEKADINKAATKSGMGILFGSLEGTAARGAVLGTKGAMVAKKGLDKAYKVVDLPQQKFLQAAGMASQKFGKKGEALANLLNEASGSEKSRKVALMFSAAQNPNYREMLQDIFPEMFGNEEE